MSVYLENRVEVCCFVLNRRQYGGIRCANMKGFDDALQIVLVMHSDAVTLELVVHGPYRIQNPSLIHLGQLLTKSSVVRHSPTTCSALLLILDNTKKTKVAHAQTKYS